MKNEGFGMESSRRKEINYKLSNAKIITFIQFKNDQDPEFSIALQVPITDQNAINELNKRTNYFLNKNPQFGNISEDPGNYHITLKLFFPTSIQIDTVKNIFKSILVEHSSPIKMEIQENAIFGYEQSRIPVALIESEQLKKFQINF